MKSCLIVLILIKLFVSIAGSTSIRSKNVLVIGPLDSGTHMLSMSPLVIALANAGYNVSIFEWNYKKEPRNLGPKVGVYHVYESGTDVKVWKKRAIETFTGTFNGVQFVELLPTFNLITRGLVENHSDTIRAVMNVKWDFIVVDELFAYHGMGIAAFFRKHYNVPYAIYSTSQMMAITAMHLGLSRNLVSRPYLITRDASNENELYDVKNFIHRLENAYDSGVELLGNILFSKYFGDNNYLVGVENFDFGKFFRGSSLTIADYYARWSYPIPEDTRVKSMASNCKQAGKLSNDIRKFVEDPSSNGTIYIAFGTNVFWEHSPKRILDAFFEAIERLQEYRVIFAYNGDSRNVSCHVKLLKFAPQFEILSHPKTKAYITHGGLKSSKEAVCAGVPVIYMPLYAEQTFNCHMATSMGFSLPLNKHNINAQSVEETIRKVVEGQEFKKNIERAKNLAFDRPISAVDEVLFYVGRVLKSKNGFFDFQNKSAKIDFYQYFFVEILSVLLILIFVIAKE